MVAYLLLGLGLAAGLLLIPFGWPGLWLQLGTLALFGWWSDFAPIGTVSLVLLVTVALIAELLEAILTGGRIGPARCRRSATGGIAGGCTGAAFGTAFPLLGSPFGALVGALLGAFVAALTGRAGPPRSVAILGETIAMGVKTSAAVVVAVFTILTLMR
ncbi:MAG: DUF456 family protein [Gemmatimonadota bacterium]